MSLIRVLAVLTIGSLALFLSLFWLDHGSGLRSVYDGPWLSARMFTTLVLGSLVVFFLCGLSWIVLLAWWGLT